MIWMGRGTGSDFVHFLGVETRSSFVHFLVMETRSSFVHFLEMETRSSFAHILEMFDFYPVIGENTLASHLSDGFLHYFNSLIFF